MKAGSKGAIQPLSHCQAAGAFPSFRQITTLTSARQAEMIAQCLVRNGLGRKIEVTLLVRGRQTVPGQSGVSWRTNTGLFLPLSPANLLRDYVYVEVVSSLFSARSKPRSLLAKQQKDALPTLYRLCACACSRANFYLFQ